MLNLVDCLFGTVVGLVGGGPITIVLLPRVAATAARLAALR